MIHIKTQEEIKQIKECGLISSKLFKYIKKFIKPGISTKELDKICEDFIRKNNAVPSFKGYQGFPSSVCISVNEEIIHGIPCKRKLKQGDILGIDVGILKNGLISDSAYTFKVGNVSSEIQELLDRTEMSLYLGISKIKNDTQINNVSGAIYDYVTKFGYGVVKNYCGHGVGYKNHEDPEIPNYRFTKGKRRLKTGMVIALEPMINLGDDYTHELDDGWTVVTVDGEYSAHFEHTVAVTDNGFEILTMDPEDMDSINQRFFKEFNQELF